MKRKEMFAAAGIVFWRCGAATQFCNYQDADKGIGRRDAQQVTNAQGRLRVGARWRLLVGEFAQHVRGRRYGYLV